MKTREEYLEAIYKIAKGFTNKGGYDSDKEWEMCKLCGEWNNEHWGGQGENSQIFLMIWAEDSEGRVGFAVEDDFFPVADWND